MSSNERTGWRGQEMSKRHRLYGLDCPAADVDFMLVEYDNKQPKALVEYKHELAMPVLASDPNLIAVTNLANLAGLPIFGVRYASDCSWFVVAPLNALATAFQPEKRTMSEIQYVELLYRLRGRTVPDNVVEKLAPTIGAAQAVAV